MKKFLKIAVGIIGGIIILAAVVALGAVSLGYAYVGVKKPADTIVVQSSICSNGDIEKYNKLLVVFPANQAEQDAKVEDFKELGTEIKAKANYLEDPTCVYMAYGVATQERNRDDAQTHYETLVKLSEQGKYPKNTILDLTSLDSMKPRIESLRNPAEVERSPLGSG